MNERKQSPIRPASPGQILSKALADSGRDEEWLAKRLGCKRRFIRDLLADREVPSVFEAIETGRALNRSDLKLVAAAVAVERWDEEERRIAKERKR